MACHLKTVVFLAIAAASSANAFEIYTTSPQSITVSEGGDIDLWCLADDYWEWCDIIHIESGKTCEHVWNKVPSQGSQYVKVGTCKDFEDRFKFIGDVGYKVQKCGGFW